MGEDTNDEWVQVRSRSKMKKLPRPAAWAVDPGAWEEELRVVSEDLLAGLAGE